MAERVTVLFFAALREQIGQESLSVSLPQGGLSVAALRQNIEDADPAVAQALLDQPRLRVAVNHTLTTFEHLVKPGDEVAFFPPMTGG